MITFPYDLTDLMNENTNLLIRLTLFVNKQNNSTV